MALAAALTGCGKGTYLVLDFEGATLPAVYGIRVSLTNHAPDGTTKQSVGTLPSATNTTAISLPTSAAFKLNDQSGTLDIVAEALDLAKKTLATQTLDATPIEHAQTWTLTFSWDIASGKLTAAPPQTATPAPKSTSTAPGTETGSPVPAPTDDDPLEVRGIEPVWR